MKYGMDFDVRSYEIDSRSIIKPSVIFQYMQESMEAQMKDSDVGYHDLHDKKRLAFILSRMTVEIFKPIKQWDKIRVYTWCEKSKGAIYPRYHEFILDNEVVIKASAVWGLINIDSREIVLADEYDLGGYPIDRKLEMNIPNRVRIPKDIEFNHVERTEVRYSKIDINGHINNTIYPDMLYDVIPSIENYNITSINMRYVSEAKFGDVIDVYLSGLLDPDEYDARADKIAYVYSKIGDSKNVEATFGLKRR